MLKKLLVEARAASARKQGLITGVKKAQISKHENSLTDARLESIVMVRKSPLRH